MLSNHNDQITIKQYLLGQLADTNLDQFEQRLFTDDDLFDELLATEDELIVASLAGELSPAEKECFAKYFLITPERQQKLRFRKALQRVAKAKQQELRHKPEAARNLLPWRAPIWAQWATLSLAALVMIGGIIVVLRSYQDNLAEVTLIASSSEREVGRAAQRIKLMPQYTGLKLHLTLAQPTISAKDYRVEMLTDDGKNKTLVPVSENGQVVDVVIRASDLPRGRCVLNVYAITPDGTQQRIPGNYELIVE
jgi:hypothetical protein